MRHEISSERPLLTIHQTDGVSIRGLWQLLPADLRPYCALHLSKVKPWGAPALPKLRDMLAEAKEAGIPAILMAQSWLEGSENYFPVDDLAALFEEFPNLIGLRSCELSCFSLNDSQKKHLIELMDVCGKYDAWLTWQEMGYPHNYQYKPVSGKQHVFIQAGADEELFDAVFRNGESIIFTDKQNGWMKFFLTRSLALGMWASGITSQWGVNPEDWWWYETGFGPRYAASKGARGMAPEHNSGMDATKGIDYASALSAPEILFAQYMLHAVAAGATFYSFEHPGRACVHRDWNGEYKMTPAWNNVIYPLMKMAVEEKLIPSREEALEQMPVAYQITDLNEEELKCPSEQLFRPLYGARASDDEIMDRGTSTEFIPTTGRYFQLPVLPKLAPESVHSNFKHIIRTNRFSSAEELKAFFDQVFPRESTGDAMVMRARNKWFISNTHENKDVTEEFEFSFSHNGTNKSVSGRLKPHSILIVRKVGNNLHLHANNYNVDSHIWDEGRPDGFDFESYLKNYVTNPDDSKRRVTNIAISGIDKNSAEVNYETVNGEVEQCWSDQEQTLSLTLTHNGPVDVQVAIENHHIRDD